jgi:hypothetical protein
MKAVNLHHVTTQVRRHRDETMVTSVRVLLGDVENELLTSFAGK